jgi:secreted protein with Ig-like and vWFA domain
MSAYEFNERLTSYALGELDEATRIEVEKELAAHPDLQAELAEVQSLAGMLRSELAAEAQPSLTPEQQRSLLSQATTSSDLADAARRKRLRRWAIVGAEVAAGFAVMAGLVVFFRPPLAVEPEIVSRQFLPRSANSKGFDVIDTSSNVALSESGDADGYHTMMTRVTAGSSATPLQNESLVLSAPEPSPTTLTSTGPLASDMGSRVLEANSKRAKEAKDLEPTVRRNMSLVDSKSNAGQPDPSFRWSTAQSESKPKPAPKFMSTQDESRKKNLTTLASDPRAAVLFSDAEASRQAGIDRGRVPSELAERHYRESERARPEGESNEAYEAPPENTFLTPSQQPLSTFSIDVDSASYANIRRFFAQGQVPPPAAVRIEEMINYFNYSYPQPANGEPFSVLADAAPCPWQRDHYLARIALQARTIDKAKRPPTNLVFLLDVSGSMQAANKLPLVKQAMTMLAEELNERDRIAIVTYAGDAGVKLPSTPGSDQTRIMQSIDALQAGGSTNGAAGISLAYEEALRHFNGEGENRVILCTDGDFNVGVSSDEQLVQLIQEQAKTKVFLSIFGFGMGNLKDAKLEKLADKGNGHYGYIDDLKEARRVFNEELVGTLYTVAKDVKIQVEFNPLTVGAYRLIGYENRALADRDFNDDTKDAGEIGAGHTVTALYEIVPRGKWPKAQPVDALKYGNAAREQPVVEDVDRRNVPPESADDLFTVKLRYKQPTADTSVKTVDYVVDDIAGKKVVPAPDLVWAASVAAFGMHLRHSQFVGQWTLNDIHETAQGAVGPDANGRRREFLDLIQSARRLRPQVNPTGPGARE